MTLEELIAQRIQAAESLEALGEILRNLLNEGFSVFADGTLLSTRQRVTQLQGLVLEIYPREHPPPHFHVRGGDVDASFSILDCSLLQGQITRGDLELIQLWHAHSRGRLIEVWNATRPSDCPVGPIIVSRAT